MVAQSTAIATAKAFIRECKKSGLELDKAFLFGSFAKNTQHDGSDIDVLLVSKKFSGNRIKDLDLYSSVNIKYPQVEIHPCSAKKFQSPSDFLNEILSESIELV